MAMKLTVPAMANGDAEAAEIRPKYARLWVESLPLTQTFESARILANTLAVLNRSKASEDERFALLEIYRPTLEILLSELAEDYSTAHLPLPEKSRQAVNLARELLIELAGGYKI